MSIRFTHSDPFEDTESTYSVIVTFELICFTHSDPFEDTESCENLSFIIYIMAVSPTPIRLRILKAPLTPVVMSSMVVSPTPIRLRILKDNRGFNISVSISGFTHSDPFEDTESQLLAPPTTPLWCFTHSDPFEDTES